MGTLHYSADGHGIQVPDRALAHLKVVLVAKLRRRESFTLTWEDSADDDPRRRITIWINPGIPVRFVFDSPEPAELDATWIARLATSANTTGGILLDAASLAAPPGPASTD